VAPGQTHAFAKQPQTLANTRLPADWRIDHTTADGKQISRLDNTSQTKDRQADNLDRHLSSQRPKKTTAYCTNSDSPLSIRGVRLPTHSSQRHSRLFVRLYKHSLPRLVGPRGCAFVSSSFRPGSNRAGDAFSIRPAALEPADPPRRPIVAPLLPRTDELSLPLPSVPPDTMSTSSDATDSEVPPHLRVLFLSTVEDAHLSPTMASDFKDLLIQHQDTFAKSSTDIGFCNLLQHDIDTADAAPIRQPPHRPPPPPASGTAEDDLVAEMLVADVIESSDSPWASPVCLAKKPDGSYRFCVDYRRVNAVSCKDAYPILDIQDAFDSLRGAKYFATIDLLSGYWQIGPQKGQHFVPVGASTISSVCPSGGQMPPPPSVDWCTGC